MKISKKDYEKLCVIAQKLNDTEQEDFKYNQIELWENLNDVIKNIKEK